MRMTEEFLVFCNASAIKGLFVIALCVVLAASNDIRLRPTAQALPSGCWQQFQFVSFGCPPQDLEYDKRYWKHLSMVCCQDYPGTVLHCQQDTDVLPACLSRRIVDKGQYSAIDIDNIGYPVLRAYPCDNSSFEPRERQSDSLTYPKCSEKKSTCSKVRGQTLLCQGGTENDDLCICNHDYTPSPSISECLLGFTENSECQCLRNPCPKGTKRTLSINRNMSCTHVPVQQEYSCYPGTERFAEDLNGPSGEITETPTIAIITPMVVHVSDNDLSENDTRRNSDNKDDAENSVLGVSIVTLSLVLAAAFALLVVAVVFLIVWLKRRYSGEYVIMNREGD